ncbi:MAG TPA: hypothetical protein VFR02_03310, partial [bacterium]|nr:hypothetical protein [bacterium]
MNEEEREGAWILSGVADQAKPDGKNENGLDVCHGFFIIGSEAAGTRPIDRLFPKKSENWTKSPASPQAPGGLSLISLHFN